MGTRILKIDSEMTEKNEIANIQKIDAEMAEIIEPKVDNPSLQSSKICH